MFKEDLTLGQYFEYDSYKLSEGKFKPYDIVLLYNKKKYKIEVKADRLAAKTGNFAIEFQCNGKLSGILTTEADVYVYYVIKPVEDVYIIPVSKLKKLIQQKKYIRTVKGGDNYNSNMYLFDKSLLEKYQVN